MRAPLRTTPLTASHRNAWKCLVAAAAALPLATLLAGCERAAEQADRMLDQQFQEARGEGGTDIAKLQQASEAAALTDAGRAYAKQVLAQAELEAARARLRAVDAREVQIARLLGEINTLATRIAANNRAIDAYRQFLDQAAKRSKDALQAAAAGVQGAGDQKAWPAGGQVEGQQPTLAAVTAELERVGGEIAKLEEQQKQLQEQRAAAEQQAAELFRKADTLRGQQAVKVFTEASAQQKAATDLAIQIAAIDAQLQPLGKQQDLAKMQQERLTATAGDFQKLIQQTDANAKQIDELIAARGELTKAMVSGPEPAAPPPRGGAAAAEAEGNDAAAAEAAAALAPTRTTLAGKAAELGRLVGEAEAARQEAVGHLTSAIANLTKAKDLVTGLQNRARERAGQPAPDQSAWQSLVESYDPSHVQLQLANAHELLASTYRDAASSLAARQQTGEYVQTVLKAADVPVPQGLDANLAGAWQEARKQALEHYEQAITAFAELKDRGESGARAAAGHVAALHARSLLHLGGPQPDDAAAKKDLAEAQRAVKESQGVQFPLTLLVSIGMGPSITEPTTAPTTQEGGDATTQPAEGEGATTTPADGAAQ